MANPINTYDDLPEWCKSEEFAHVPLIEWQKESQYYNLFEPGIEAMFQHYIEFDTEEANVD